MAEEEEWTVEAARGVQKYLLALIDAELAQLRAEVVELRRLLKQRAAGLPVKPVLPAICAHCSLRLAHEDKDKR